MSPPPMESASGVQRVAWAGAMAAPWAGAEAALGSSAALNLRVSIRWHPPAFVPAAAAPSQGGASRPDPRTGNAPVSDTMHPVRPRRGAGTTADDHRTALRFVLGRPGWLVEAGATTQGGAHLRLTTPRPDTGGQRFWRLVRPQQGLVVHDDVSGQRCWAVPTMRDALVEVWEAVTDVAPD